MSSKISLLHKGQFVNVQRTGNVFEFEIPENESFCLSHYSAGSYSAFGKATLELSSCYWMKKVWDFKYSNPDDMKDCKFLKGNHDIMLMNFFHEIMDLVKDSSKFYAAKESLRQRNNDLLIHRLRVNEIEVLAKQARRAELEAELRTIDSEIVGLTNKRLYLLGITTKQQ